MWYLHGIKKRGAFSKAKVNEVNKELDKVKRV